MNNEPNPLFLARGSQFIVDSPLFIVLSVFLILPEPEEPDDNEKDWQKIGSDDSWDRKMEGVILRSKNEDSNDHRDPCSEAFFIPENAP
jgi:hypothetical protein